MLRDGLTIYEGEPEVEAFRNVMFPMRLGLQARVEPRFSTTIATSPGGFEYRNADWQQARLSFDVGPGLRSIEDIQELMGFFRAMRGDAIAFRFRDAIDFSSRGMTDAPTAGDVLLGTGDGIRQRFELVKPYDAGEARRITRPVDTSVIVSLNGAATDDWELAPGGVIEFPEPPGTGVVVRAGFLFDVPVRFAEPKLSVSGRTHRAGEIASVPLIEVREA